MKTGFRLYPETAGAKKPETDYRKQHDHNLERLPYNFLKL